MSTTAATDANGDQWTSGAARYGAVVVVERAVLFGDPLLQAANDSATHTPMTKRSVFMHPAR
jgi:hypothetical protein